MEILKKEFESLQRKGINDWNEENFQISDKLMQRKFQKTDSTNILKNLLFSLSFEKKMICKLDSIVQISDYMGKELSILLAFAEIFLSLRDKNIKDVVSNFFLFKIFFN